MFTHDQTPLGSTHLEDKVWNRPGQLNSCPVAGSFGVGILPYDCEPRRCNLLLGMGQALEANVRAVRSLCPKPLQSLLRTVRAVLDYCCMN